MRQGIDFPYLLDMGEERDRLPYLPDMNEERDRFSLPDMGEERDRFSLPGMGEEGYICAIYLVIWVRRGIDLPFAPDMGRERQRFAQST